MRSIPIDALVRWAFQQELPKAHPLGGSFVVGDSGVAAIWRLGKLGTRVQESSRLNEYDLISSLDANASPHPDSILVWEAVRRLADMSPTVPDGWDPLCDMSNVRCEDRYLASAFDRLYLPLPASRAVPVGRGYRHWRLPRRQASGTRQLRRPVSDLVVTHAILGGAPAWQFPEPEIRIVLGANGRPVYFRRSTVETEDGPREIEVNGFDAKRGRRFPDAYVKHYFDPDPSIIVEARAEYEIWYAAMAALVEELEGTLSDHWPVAPDMPERPWETPPLPSARVIPEIFTQRVFSA